ncbi:MAG: diguanylate cyclase [Acholeplasmatales bacterium]|nr:diguanylate cyclase [Acholeplasmatales bacterium]
MAKLSLNEVLNLDNSKQSIKKIDIFLSGESKYSDNFMEVIAFKGKMLHILDDTTEALKLLFSYIAELKKLRPKGIIAICDSIIYITEDISKFDQSLKYINLKKNFLPISSHTLYIKDMIHLYLLENKKSEAIKLILDYLKDDLSKDEIFFAKETLANLYYETKEYDKYIELSSLLISNYQNNLELSKIEDVEINLLKINLLKEEYDEIIKNANRILENLTDPDKIIITASMLMKSYIVKEDFKYASVVESCYEDKLDSASVDNQKSFINNAIDLYTKLHSLVSVRGYQARLDALKEDEPEVKPKKKRKKTSDDIYDIPVIEDELIEEEIEVNNQLLTETEPKLSLEYDNVYKTVKYNDVEVSEYYLKLNDLLGLLNQIPYDLKFREFYRQMMMILAKSFKFEEAYFLSYDNDKFVGYHYKMERVYDKTPAEEVLADSAMYMSYTLGSEIIINDDSREYLKNIIDDTYYEDNIYVLSLPIITEIETRGSISYISHEPFLNVDMAYEGLKIASSILNSRFVYGLYKKIDDNKKEKLLYLAEHIDAGYKEEALGNITLSDYGMNMLHTFKNLSLEDYFIHMNNQDITRYKNARERLLDLRTTFEEITYDYKLPDKILKIKEKMYSLLIDGIVNIISIFTDITDLEEEKKSLISLAYRNPNSKIDSEVKLMVDLKDALYDHRFALCILKVVDFDIYKELYGYNFERQLIYALGDKLKECIDDFSTNVYHFSGSEYALLLSNVNDKRTIEGKVRKWLTKVAKALHELNTRINITFACGCFKPATVSNLDPNRVINNALDGLQSAYSLDGSIRFAHYDSLESEARFKENSLITHISESIDMNNIGLTYKQIVNIKKKEVLGYKVDINLDNYEVDLSYFKEVIERRNLKEKITKYLIYTLFKEMKMLYDSTHYKLNVFIDLDVNMLNDDMMSFITDKLNFYKIDTKNIILNVNDTNNKYVGYLYSLGFNLASDNLLEIYRDKISYLFFDYHLINKDNSEYLSLITSDKKIKMIMSEINTEDDLKVVTNEGYEYVFGNYYRKLTRIKNIIDKLEN